MAAPVWVWGPLPASPMATAAPIVWYSRLDEPEVQQIAGRAALSGADLEDLATRPQSAMRSLRRQLTRVLVCKVTGDHPDNIIIRRTERGAPVIAKPAGWYLSLAGQWPHCLIGLSRNPIGVDIEPKNSAAPPDDVFTAAERESMPHGWQADLERLQRWVAKEAHAKLFGVASSIDPADIDTVLETETIVARSESGTSVCSLMVDKDLVCAVASWRPG